MKLTSHLEGPVIGVEHTDDIGVKNVRLVRDDETCERFDTVEFRSHPFDAGETLILACYAAVIPKDVDDRLGEGEQPPESEIGLQPIAFRDWHRVDELRVEYDGSVRLRTRNSMLDDLDLFGDHE